MQFKFNNSAFLGIVISLVLAIGIMATEATETYVNKDIGFSFEYPASWKVSGTMRSSERN